MDPNDNAKKPKLETLSARGERLQHPSQRKSSSSMEPYCDHQREEMDTLSESLNNPEDWVREKTHDGRPTWRHVHTLELSWGKPLCWRGLEREPENMWTRKVRDDGFTQFIHKTTGEIVLPRRSTVLRSEKRQKDVFRSEGEDSVVDDSETALGRKVFHVNKEDLERRQGHLGSTRSVFDREKYNREFKFVENDDGSGKIVLDHVPTKGYQHRHRNKEDSRDNGEVAFIPKKFVGIYKNNPHLHQVFANGREFINKNRPFVESDRVIPRDFNPRSTYSRRQGEVKTVEHWGQRKLLLSEIEFLTKYGSGAKKVVYAGAAPGNHIKFLSEIMFPDLKWFLVDPAPFECEGTEKIKLRQDFFTDELATELSQEENILFICDIRSMDSDSTRTRQESRVAIDMEWQEKWVRIMKPVASMLKFRLPYSIPDDVEGTVSSLYLDGDLHLPVFGGRTTTECRLFVTNPESTRSYSHKFYEEYMFHHNTTTRTAMYCHSYDIAGIDHCFDCCSELFILEEYVKNICGLEGEALQDEVESLSCTFSSECSHSERTLVTINDYEHYIVPQRYFSM
eukprot:m.129762 g.129762  ORF g.129762 m.129762 type:complete len:566 (+) comp13052_c0_seq1:341-2038(+)